MRKQLTNKQANFAAEFVQTGNASEAYRRVYDVSDMTERSIQVEASKVKKHPAISLRIQYLEQLKQKRRETTADKVIAEYAKLAFLDIRKAFDNDGNLKAIQEMDDEVAAAIAGLEFEEIRGPEMPTETMEPQPHGGSLKRRNVVVGRLAKIKLSDKRAALDSLSKILGLFIDRQELTGKDGEPLNIAGIQIRFVETQPEQAHQVIDIQPVNGHSNGHG